MDIYIPFLKNDHKKIELVLNIYNVLQQEALIDQIHKTIKMKVDGLLKQLFYLF